MVSTVITYTADVHRSEAKRIRAAALRMVQAKLPQVARDYRNLAKAHQLAAQRLQRLACAITHANSGKAP